MKNYSSFLFLLVGFASQAQYFNRIEFDSQRMPDELHHADKWLALFVNSLFYTGTVGDYNFDGYFSVVTKKEGISLPLPDTGIVFTLDLDKTPNTYLKSPAMKMRYKSLATRVSRHRDFDFKQINDPRYYFEFVLDVYQINEAQLLQACLRTFGEGDAAESAFLDRVNAQYNTRLKPIDRLKYQFLDEDFDGKPDNKQRDKLGQMIALLEEGVPQNQSIDDIIYAVSIATADASQQNKNLDNFLTKVVQEDFHDKVNSMLAQEFTFTPFAGKVQFESSALKATKNPAEKVVFDIEDAVCTIVPSKEGYHLDMVFTGNFNSAFKTNGGVMVKSAEAYKTLFISITATKVVVEARGEGAKTVEIYNRKNALKVVEAKK